MSGFRERTFCGSDSLKVGGISKYGDVDCRLRGNDSGGGTNPGGLGGSRFAERAWVYPYKGEALALRADTLVRPYGSGASSGVGDSGI